MSTFTKESSGLFVANERIYAAADGKLVREGDHRAAALFALPGQAIPSKTARRFKLDENTKVEPLEKKNPPHQGFAVSHAGGFHAKPKTETANISPEETVARSVRPETPTRTRS